jgi:hypothetical protein
MRLQKFLLNAHGDHHAAARRLRKHESQVVRNPAIAQPPAQLAD